MLNIVDRYISKLFWSYFLSGLVVFATLFLVVDYMSNFTQIKTSLDLIGQYYMLYLPAAIYQMIPVGCLMATIFTLGTLNRHNELVALYSSGMSLFRICAPILVWVVLISIGAFVMSDQILPPLAKKRAYLYWVEILKQPDQYSTVKTDKIWYRSKNLLFNIKTLQSAKGEAQGITLYYFNDNWDLVQILSAKKVIMHGKRWDLRNGSVTLFASEQNSPLTQNFKSKVITMDADFQDLKTRTNVADTLSLSQLHHYIQANKAAGLDTLHYEVEYQSKFSFAFAALVMTLLGIPFSVSQGRSGGVFANIGLCMGLAFLYWSFYSSFLTLAQYGQVSPLIGAWVPNLTVGAGSGLLALRLKR